MWDIHEQRDIVPVGSSGMSYLASYTAYWACNTVVVVVVVVVVAAAAAVDVATREDPVEVWHL